VDGAKINNCWRAEGQTLGSTIQPKTSLNFPKTSEIE
jgi:hypothetical protein